jgi:hypothetical protein
MSLRKRGRNRPLPCLGRRQAAGRLRVKQSGERTLALTAPVPLRELDSVEAAQDERQPRRLGPIGPQNHNTAEDTGRPAAPLQAVLRGGWFGLHRRVLTGPRNPCSEKTMPTVQRSYKVRFYPTEEQAASAWPASSVAYGG